MSDRQNIGVDSFVITGLYYYIVFFFSSRRRHTRFDCDWSSDVCSSDLIVWTLGETLRQARLDKGVSLADAARETRIRRSYLEALEAEDAAALPPQVYTRGFLKTYAEYLGLSPESMVDLYQPSTRREPSPTLRSAVPHVAIPRQIPLRPVMYGISSIVFVAMVGFAWNWYQDVQHTLNGDQT